MRRVDWAIKALLACVWVVLTSAVAYASSGTVPETLPNTGAFKARHVRDAANVSVIELTGNYDNTLNSAFNVEPRAVVAREFFRTHSADYDFLVVFSTFEFDTLDAVAFYHGAKNDVQGIGLTQFDNSSYYGSPRLQGYWQDHEGTRLRDSVVALDALVEQEGRTSAAFAQASAWLARQVVGNTDYAARRALSQIAAEPYGMLLVTGPTGSGKTTTLYAAITETHTAKDKIITIEDPVEYELQGVLQIPVNEKKGLTFARGLRSILRHDPDKIMVGEIRDAETAEIAVQSALTGHLVLSTVHANGVLDVFSRFTHMNVDPHSLSSALNGIWAQRLLRTVCRNCSHPVVPDDGELDALGLAASWVEGASLRQGRGCGDCRGTGFKGRKAIAEVLVMSDALRELISSKASIVRVKEEARRNGTRFLREAALDLAWRGETTLAEVLRVTLQAT